MVQYEADDYYDYDSSDDVVVTGDAIADVMEGLGERCNEVSKDEIASALEATTSVEKAIEWLFVNILDQELVIDLTGHILKRLGDNKNRVTKDEIKSSLYYYYYDVDKTEAYLKKKIQTAAKKEMAEGKTTPNAAPTSNSPFHNFTPNKCNDQRAIEQADMAAFFADTPWLSRPTSEMSIFTPPAHLQLRPCLLGGSKLQALAARRKKAAAASVPSIDNTPAPPTVPATELDVRLQLAQASLGDRTSDSSAKRATTSVDSQAQPPTKRLFKSARSSETSEATQEVLSSSDAETKAEVAKVPSPTIVACPPSAFAQALFGSPPTTQGLLQTFPLPYSSSSHFAPEIFAKPSPDDIVLAAQAQAKLKADTLKKQGSPASKKSVDTQAQPVDENPGFTVKSFRVPQSKKLNVPELYKHRVENEKKSISFVVAGHVDAGKSTLMGRLLLETGVIDDYTVRKLESDAAESGKKSFGLAWILDSREEEREHGVTIDIATRFFETERTKFTILDAPGHRDFVPNMISGASLADFAVLVVDASTNAFEKGLKGQTLEHVLLLRSIGVQRVIIAINKLEMVGWAQERYEEITSAMTAFMLNLNFPRKMITFLPLSGIDGINLVKPPTNLSSLDWYKGPTLIQALEETESAERQLNQPARMEVAEIFTSLHSGLTVSGRLQTGTLQVGDLMAVSTETQPKFYIKSLLVGDEPRDWAVAGELVDLVVVGIDPAEIRAGDVVSISTDPVQLMNKLTMRVLAFETFMSCNVDIHRGTNHSAGCITNILATLDKSTGVNQVLNPFVVKQSTMARVNLVLREPIAVARGQRVVIRREGRTIAAGVVEA